MTVEDSFVKEYEERAFIFGRISTYMKIELEELLYNHEIPYLTTTSRIKTLESVKEKIERKEYLNPFDQIEDFCGFRIICYYRSDVLKIGEILNDEFEVIESFNKEDLLNDNEFGYRSYHIIAKIPKTRTPMLIEESYSQYKFEIQIRTVLMHAWAEIQHKLAYKNESQIDKSMRKEFAFLSAKLEESDFQFERLKNESDRIQNEFRAELEEEQVRDDVDLNLDSLRAFLAYEFPDRKEDLDGVAGLLDQLNEAQIGLKEVLDAHQKAESYISTNLEVDSKYFTRSGIARTALNLVNDDFWNNYVKTVNMELYSSWVEEREAQRELFKKKISN